MTDRIHVEAGSPDEHPMRKVLRMYRDAGRRFAEERARLEEEGTRIVFCGPDCPAIYHRNAEHAHTWWDMWRMKDKAEYECQLRRANEGRQGPGVDIRARMNTAGVGDRHADALRGELDERPSFRATRRWWSQPRGMLPPDAYGNPARMGPMPFPWLVLLGHTDTGKSLSAAWALREHLRAWKWNAAPSGLREPPPAIFFAAADLVTVNTFGWEGAQGRDGVENLRRTPFLVLDDLGSVVFNDHIMAMLYGILDSRYRDGLKTVITSNKTARDFEAWFDFRGLDREDGGNSGRMWRRAKERGYIAHLSRERGKFGGTLFVGGHEARKEPR